MKKGTKAEEHLSSAQMERLKFIEYLAYFQGTVTRDDIKNKFRISPASSTKDFAMYNQVAPHNLTYNIRLKCYEISDSFAPYFDIYTQTERLPIYTLPKLNRPANRDTIATVALIARAIQGIKSLNITYSSTSSGVTQRQIVPVALADTLLRWHLRAFDRKNGKFVDFVVGRIGSVAIINEDTIQPHEHPNEDIQWLSFIKLKIAPHPQNLDNVESLRGHDGEGNHLVDVRAAMAGYFLELWNVDCSPDTSLTGKQYQYVLLNLKEVSKVADLTLAPGYNGTK